MKIINHEIELEIFVCTCDGSSWPLDVQEKEAAKPRFHALQLSKTHVNSP